MKNKISIAIRIILIMKICLCMTPVQAREVMTLQQCRDSAIANNSGLKAAYQKTVMADYDKKIAVANYFPNISANATWQYNSRNLNLLGKSTSDALTSAGTTAQGVFDESLSKLLSDPTFSQLIQNSPELQNLFAKIAATDIATPINAIGREINNAFELDIENIFAGSVSLQQPIFMGGKIIAANKMAELARQLAEAQYDTEYRALVTEVDQAYWQIVSIAGKKKVAEEYSRLLGELLHDAELMEMEGVATNADVLTIKVKANEADLLLTKATNGLALSKMLLCRLCGLDLHSDIALADEELDRLPVPQMPEFRSDEEIFEARPEIRSLTLASGIYDKKVSIARADMMPKIALTANYFITNPNMYHGYRNEFAGIFNVGIMVNIPIIHGCEAMNKVGKAKAEAVMTRYRLQEAKESVTLQVNQLRNQTDEAVKKLYMAESNMDCAEENLRSATLGFNEGIVPASTVLEAQTAWVKAHSEYIDAGVELQLYSAQLETAQGK